MLLSRGLGRRIHGSVEDTKLSTNKQHSLPMSISSPKCQCQSLRQTANVNLLAKLPMSISSPNCQCQSLRQTANVNLLAKMPMSISSPKCQCQSPRQNANVNLLAKMPTSVPSPKCTTHEPLTSSPSCSPRADLIQNRPTLGILRPMYLLGLDSHSALPISARNMSTELYLARSATHRPNLSGSHFSLTPKLEVLYDCHGRSVHSQIHLCHPRRLSI
jgi:hypothetical protein